MAISTTFTTASALQSSASFDPASLKGKSVIITGGASGLGEAFVRSFVAHGAFVTFGDISADRGNAIVESLGESKAAFVSCDVNVWADQLSLFKAALQRSPSRTIDVVVANAGVGLKDEVFTKDESEGDEDPKEPSLRTLMTNLVAVQYTTKLALHYFPRQPEGEGRDRCLLLTGSIAGYLDQPGSPQYCSSKWGIRGVMRSLRRIIPKEGMRVNMIAPWFIRTNIMSPETVGRLEADGVLFAVPEDAAEAIIHLASDGTINGRSLAIVPRELDPRGYVDLKKDVEDEIEGDLVTELMNLWRKPGKV